MATKAQIAANRANAQRSTGPKTGEGKARVSQNALTHGFTAKTLIVPDFERHEFAAFEAELLAEVRPQGALEGLSFQQLVHAAWNLHRYYRMQAHCFQNSTNPNNPRDPGSFSKIAHLSRYQSQMQRAYTRALAELRKLQTERALRERLSGIRPVPPLPMLADFGKLFRLTKQTQSAPSKRPADPPVTNVPPETVTHDAEIDMQPAA